jgi:hypothetical protein
MRLQRPASVVGKGLVAGATGTVASTISRMIEQRIRGLMFGRMNRRS